MTTVAVAISFCAIGRGRGVLMSDKRSGHNDGVAGFQLNVLRQVLPPRNVVVVELETSRLALFVSHERDALSVRVFGQATRKRDELYYGPWRRQRIGARRGHQPG